MKSLGFLANADTVWPCQSNPCISINLYLVFLSKCEIKKHIHSIWDLEIAHNLNILPLFSCLLLLLVPDLEMKKCEETRRNIWRAWFIHFYWVCL